MNFEGNKKKAFDFIEKTDYDYTDNHIHAYMATNLYLNNQQSKKALEIATNINPSNLYLDLPFWDLEKGYAYLNELKLDAAKAALQNFIGSFLNTDFFQKKTCLFRLHIIELSNFIVHGFFLSIWVEICE